MRWSALGRTRFKTFITFGMDILHSKTLSRNNLCQKFMLIITAYNLLRTVMGSQAGQLIKMTRCDYLFGNSPASEQLYSQLTSASIKKRVQLYQDYCSQISAERLKRCRA